jgi:hypothetical protein
VESSKLSAGNHPLRSERNLSCASGAKRAWNLERAPNFQHRDNVVDRNVSSMSQSLADATSTVRCV